MSAANSMEHPRLLLVEDETKMAWEIAAELKSLGYLVRIAATEAAGLEAIRSEPAALLILDRMLSGADSLSMIDTLRSECIRIPVLVISALAGVDERIRGLKAGGDDYLTKPFVMEELAARVEALLRRTSDARATSLQVGPLQMDLLERKASRGQRVLDLLPAEFKLLEYLMRHPGQTMTRAMILEDVWHFRAAPQTNLVDVHMGKLRRKVDEPGETPLIRRIRSAGFVLDVND